MRGILALVRRDIAHATRNTMAIIVVVGLTVLPSLFTWFNVIASWNPFANTTGLTVAIANTDEGYQSDLVPLRLNIGEQVVSALRANEEFTWVVTTEQQAIDGTRSGEYYAALVLPATFSQDMLTFYTDGAVAVQIDYYTNEKKNALAPKITGQGADAVSAGINTVFAETLSEIGINLLSQLSGFLSSADTDALFTRLESDASQLAAQLRSGARNADAFTALIDSSKTLVASSAQLIAATGQSFSDAAGAVTGAVETTESLQATIDGAVASLGDAIAASVAGYEQVGTAIDGVFAAAGDQTASQLGVIEDLATQVQTHIDAYQQLRATVVDEIAPLVPDAAQPGIAEAVAGIDRAIAHHQAVFDALGEAASRIEAGDSAAQSSHEQLDQAIAEAKASLQAVHDDYTSTVAVTLDQLSETMSTAFAAIEQVGADLDSAAAGLSGAEDSIDAKLDKARAVTADLSSTLNEAAQTFDALEQALVDARTTGDFSTLQAVLGQDPQALAVALASPVGLDRVAVFPVATFGSSMAPLYTVLALWVGALLMTVTIRVSADDDVLPERPGLAPYQTYLGRYGIFALIGLAQATLLCVGNLVFVQVQAVHPLLFMTAGWVTSLVFTLTVYTAVVAFGNAGKALCVLLLVTQVSSAGGAYPLQLLPEWFQHISRFLPARYAIEAFRSAIAGVYDNDFWRAIGWLCLFIVPALLLGLALRKPLIAVNQKLVRALESTKVLS